MNNILSYNDFFQDIETLVYAKEINEGTGIKGFFNKKAGKKVAKKLEEEIEMSKSIMDGISKGLESLNDNFDALKKDIEKDKGNELKGEKQKKLDEISKILADSKEKTWDLQELIDEGEVDYAGFTANIGLATITYFGILLFPIRASVIMHKGYNYFFSLIKNTVRKALVMLQINFDQFQNLIICQGFQSANYMKNVEMAEAVADFYGQLQAKFFDDKKKDKTKYKKLETEMKAFKDKYQAEMKLNKIQQDDNPLALLDGYNNTYTKTLEALRTYSQEDVQKELDGIKNSMNKLAGGDVDLQAYGELIIAMAEEHAYKISTSIYNKFAKMSEVFSLPNQKDIIQLIKDSLDEEEREAIRVRKEKEKKEAETKEVEKEKDNTKKAEEIFKGVDGGARLGDIDEKTGKYSDVDGKNWNYEKYKDLNDDDKDIFEWWLSKHPEVLDTCDETLKVAIIIEIGRGADDMITYENYMDVLIDEISDALKMREKDEIDESYILSFTDFITESENQSDNNSQKKEDKSSEKSKEKLPSLGFDDLSSSNLDNIKDLFSDKNKEIAIVAIKVIGEKIGYKEFTLHAESIVDNIMEAIEKGEDDKSKKIKRSLYDIIENGIKKINDFRNKENTSVNTEEKSEE